jgi:hypothetical protein
MLEELFIVDNELSEDHKEIDLKEFRAKGYLQELNRKFLNPLGLSMGFYQNLETGEEFFGGIFDFRDNFGDRISLIDAKNLTEEELEDNRNKANFIQEEWEKRSKIRLEKFGYEIEPLDSLKKIKECS